jgi:hypothetical protein
MTAMSGDFGDRRASRAALCLRPSARAPPPIDVLLQTKTKVTFDRAVDRTVEVAFPVFGRSNPGIVSPFLPVGAVHSAEGRELFSFTQLPNYPFTQFR